MRNQRRILSALVLAAVMSTTLSANAGIGGANSDACIYIAGLVMRGMPEFAADVLRAIFGC